MLMRAVAVTRFGGPEAIKVIEVPVPEPHPGQVRIKVAAAALNPVDLAMRAGVFGPGQGDQIGLGWDVAGTVDAVGAGVELVVGTRVFGLATNHHKPLGTHADFVVMPANSVASAPHSLDDLHAATLPLNTLSAAQALQLLDLQPGQTVLITGAAGGVGAHAVELAHHRGLNVTALASAVDESFVLRRGASDFLARGATLPDATFDGVLDAARLGSQALAAAADHGSYVGLWPGQEPPPERDIHIAALDVQADSTQLVDIAHLADKGVLRARVAQTYELDSTPDAHQRLARGGVRGRLVITP